jgi:hypothetical protein
MFTLFLDINIIFLVRETFMYILTTNTTAIGYQDVSRYYYKVIDRWLTHVQQMFTSMFHLLGKIGGYRVTWHHIEDIPTSQCTIQAITCDMDTKQAKGKELTPYNLLYY